MLLIVNLNVESPTLIALLKYNVKLNSFAPLNSISKLRTSP